MKQLTYATRSKINSYQTKYALVKLAVIIFSGIASICSLCTLPYYYMNNDSFTMFYICVYLYAISGILYWYMSHIGKQIKWLKNNAE